MQIDKFYKQNGYKVADDFISKYKVNGKRNAITTITVYYANGTKKEENYTIDLEKDILSTMKEQAIEFKNDKLYSLIEDYFQTIVDVNLDSGVLYHLNAFRKIIINGQYNDILKLDYYLENQSLFDEYKKCFSFINEDTYGCDKNGKKIVKRTKYGFVPIVNINNLDKFNNKDLKNIKSDIKMYENVLVSCNKRSLV